MIYRIAGSTVLYLIDSLLSNYGHDERFTSILDSFEWHFVPVANPDGFLITWTTNRLLRGNSYGAPVSWWKSLFTIVSLRRDVDNNRNFGVSWRQKAGESSCGSAAFSEPETLAIAQYAKALHGRVTAFFDIHAYSQLWMYPSGILGLKPTNEKALREISAAAVAAIKTSHGLAFRYGTIAKTIYAVSGDSVDYMYFVEKVPYAFAIECRPSRRTKQGFLLPPSHIVPSGEEITAGIVAAMHVIRGKLSQVAGSGPGAAR